MIKKHIFLLVTIPMMILNIFACLFIYSKGNESIEQISDKNQRKLFNVLLSKVAIIKNSYELNEIQIGMFNTFAKNNKVRFLVVLDKDGKILFNTKKELIGSIYDDDFMSEILKNNYLNRKNIKFASEEFVELGQQINTNGMVKIAVLGIPLDSMNLAKMIFKIFLICFFILISVYSFLLPNLINKKYVLIFDNLEFLCQKILTYENISEKDVLLNDETKSISSVLIKISQIVQNFKVTLEGLKIDTLTGLCSSKYIKERLQYELLKAHRYNRPLSCMLIELFNLNYISQHFGESQIDLISKDVADILKNDLRKVDLIGRYGSSAFIIVLPEIQEKQASITAERLFNKLKQHKIVNKNNDFFLNFIIGINTYIYDKTEVNEDLFVSQIEDSLHYAKLEGANKIVYNTNHS